MIITKARIPSIQTQQQFLGQLLTITGDTRLLWLPENSDTTTSTDKSLNARVLTHSVSLATRLSALGQGYAVSFDGSTDYATTPDTANLSFGNATVDQAFSVIALARPTDTATSRTFAAKYNSSATAREWEFRLTTADQLVLGLYDESLDVAPNRASSSAVTQGAWALFGGTYSAATGGATAANDMLVYYNGLAVASTATNAGTYVAMEDTAAPVNIGARGSAGVGSDFMQGSMAMVTVVAKALTASEMWAIYQLYKSYFRF